ncbi:Cathepsin L1 [Myotis davidii]|uniref:Cathepsin L1 n=1 Tax=Myotis davidii TaxID=225400 RepID=L5LVV1_MYODS|nr:Cathepsin L1 [Myotis davidii]
MEMIDLHNQEYSLGRQSFTLAMKAFGDMTNEEFMQVMNGHQNQKHKKRRVFWEPYIAEIPPTVDWREEGCVTPVKNQGQGNEGCNGGLMDNAFQYVTSKSIGGLDSQESCPYNAKVGPCRYRSEDSVANDTGFMDIPEQESALTKAVATVGPISGAIDASHLSFRFYEDGIYHGILVVGYDFEGEESSNSKYGIVKNSWGKARGKNGYIKMANDWNNH